jgi:hypothetical protein
MDKNAELYSNIFNAVIFDAALPVERVDPMTSVSIAAGFFKGADVPVNTVVIENDGIVSISVQFNEGQKGYETFILTWAADEEFVLRVAEHAYSLIMEWNQWVQEETFAA